MASMATQRGNRFFLPRWFVSCCQRIWWICAQVLRVTINDFSLILPTLMILLKLRGHAQIRSQSLFLNLFCMIVERSSCSQGGLVFDPPATAEQLHLGAGYATVKAPGGSRPFDMFFGFFQAWERTCSFISMSKDYTGMPSVIYFQLLRHLTASLYF